MQFIMAEGVATLEAHGPFVATAVVLLEAHRAGEPSDLLAV